MIRLMRKTISRWTPRSSGGSPELSRNAQASGSSVVCASGPNASAFRLIDGFVLEQGLSRRVACSTKLDSLVRVWLRRAIACGVIASSAIGLAGCAAFRPIEGIPARYVPDEVKAASRSGKKTIDLSLLSQTQPSVYRLDAGDILAVYIEGVIPRPNEMPPVNMPQNNEEAMPALGYPIPIRQDGTISLPLLPRALNVRGMTVSQVENAVRRAYTVDRKILQTGNERVWVILHKPRHYRVLVIRQEGVEQPIVGQGGSANLGALKRGTGRVVALTAYKNDVLHALAETGGLPGLDAENTIYVIRAKRRSNLGGAANSWAAGCGPNSGWSVAPSTSNSNGPMTMPVDPTAVPPLPEGSYLNHPLPSGSPFNAAPPTLPAVPGSPDSLPGVPMTTPQGTSSPSESPSIPNDASTTGPQTRKATSANSGLQLTVLGFESDDAPKRVTPAAFNPAVPNQAVMNPLPANRTAAAIPGAVPMLAQSSDWQRGLPPTHAAEDWPEMSADAWMGHVSSGDQTMAGQNVVKIPVRLGPGEQVHFNERDILLEDGDIVFIESRDTEIFYTGGLLGGGQYTLPRDYDLDVLGAIAIAQAGGGQANANRATGGVTAMNQDVTISASQAVILRKMPNGTQVPIKVDLYRAVRHPQERVLMQPGDYLVLQYTPMEACGAFIERHLLEGALFGVASASLNRP